MRTGKGELIGSDKNKTNYIYMTTDAGEITILKYKIR